MPILNADAPGSPERDDHRRRDMWVATGTDRRIALFRPGKLYCPNGHHMAGNSMTFEGSGARLCQKKTPALGPRGVYAHEGVCDTWLYILAGLQTFDGSEPTSLNMAVEITTRELRHLSANNLGAVQAAEFLGLLAWTRR